MILIVVGVIGLFSLSSNAYAMTPVLSVANQGYDPIQVTVFGDANSAVMLTSSSYYQLSNVGIIGYTNNTGYFLGQIYPTTYNIPNGTQLGVTVNSQASNTIVWQNPSYLYPDYNYTSPLFVNPMNVTLRVGESQSITIPENNYTGNYYNYYNPISYRITSTSNVIVSSSINGTTLMLYGLTPGSATITVCPVAQYNYQNNCMTVYVIVGGNYYSNYSSGYTLPVNFVDKYPQVVAGSTVTVPLASTVYGTASRIISSKPYIAQAVVRGSNVVIYGNSPGSSDLIVCSLYGNECYTLFVTVNPKITYSNTYPYYPYNAYDNWYYSY